VQICDGLIVLRRMFRTGGQCLPALAVVRDDNSEKREVRAAMPRVTAPEPVVTLRDRIAVTMILTGGSPG
jgi:hypothetical protein